MRAVFAGRAACALNCTPKGPCRAGSVHPVRPVKIRNPFKLKDFGGLMRFCYMMYDPVPGREKGLVFP